MPHPDEEEKRKLVANTPPYQIKARTEGEPALRVGAIYPIDESEITVPDFAILDSWPRAFALRWARISAAIAGLMVSAKS